MKKSTNNKEKNLKIGKKSEIENVQKQNRTNRVKLEHTQTTRTKGIRKGKRNKLELRDQ